MVSPVKIYIYKNSNYCANKLPVSG